MATTLIARIGPPIVLAAMAAALFACAAPPPSQSSGASPSVRQQLTAEMSQCTQSSGYNPANVVGYENKLAPDELKWRNCMHQALSTYAKASPQVAPQIQALINGDIAMTAALDQGTMTRAARKARLQQLVADVEHAEQQSTSAQQQQDVEYKNTIGAIRALGR